MVAIPYFFAGTLVLAGAALAGYGWIHKPTDVLAAKDYLVFIQGLVVVVVGVGVAILNLASTRSLERLKSQLTKEATKEADILKNDLTKSTGESLQKLKSELDEAMGKRIEEYKSELTKKNDFIRAKLAQMLPKRNDGYHAMYGALDSYFRALQSFEDNKFEGDRLKAARQACEEASKSGLLVSEEDTFFFHDVWDEANRLHELGEERQSTPHGLHSLWVADGPSLGNSFLELKRKFAQSLEGNE
jgi:hypothetical protein